MTRKSGKHTTNLDISKAFIKPKRKAMLKNILKNMALTIKNLLRIHSPNPLSQSLLLKS